MLTNRMIDSHLMTLFFFFGIISKILERYLTPQPDSSTALTYGTGSGVATGDGGNYVETTLDNCKHLHTSVQRSIPLRHRSTPAYKRKYQKKTESIISRRAKRRNSNRHITSPPSLNITLLCRKELPSTTLINTAKSSVPY